MRYTRLSKVAQPKEYPVPGSLFIVIDQDAHLAVVNACRTTQGGEYYRDSNSMMYYTVLKDGRQDSMSVGEWRQRVHVEQVGNVEIREV